MNFQEQLYLHLPANLQNLALWHEARRIVQRRYGAGFFQKMEEVAHADKISGEAMTNLQISAIRQNLVSAWENTSYYRNLLNEAAIDPYKFNDLATLAKLPIQDKRTIRQNMDISMNKAFQGRQFMTHTSGTSGSGLVFPLTVNSEHYQWATWWRYRQNIGITFKSKCSIFAGRMIIPVNRRKPPYWKVLPALNHVSYSMYHLNPLTVRSYVDDLNARKIEWIHGYPSTISNLAALMQEQGLRLSFQLKFITTGAENLLDHQRNIIADVFGVMPFQHYGMAEPVANISECENHRLHIDEDFSYIELLPVEGHGNRFRIAGTSFTNEVLLFLRYETSDFVTLAENQSCPCGRNGRIIGSIDGRQEDFLTLKNGTRIGRLDHIFKDMVNVREAQIKQEKSGRIIFYVVKNKSFSTDNEKMLRKEISARLAQEDYEIVYTDGIEKSATGKLRFVISEKTT